MFRATIQDKLTIGSAITDMRIRKGFTKRELAKAIGAEEHDRTLGERDKISAYERL